MATVVVAGDVEPEQVIAQAESHFGSLAPKLQSPGRLAFTGDSARLEPQRQIELPVQHDKLCIAWTGPGFASTEYPPLEAACEILAGAKGSRLWHRIVRAERLASDVAVELRPREFGVLIVLGVVARIGVPLSAIEKVVRDEIERLAAQGPEPQELNFARLRLFGRMVRGFERVGGPQSKSDALGLSAMVCGSADSHQSRLLTMAAMQPDAVATASRWLKSTGAVLAMRPLSQRNGR